MKLHKTIIAKSALFFLLSFFIKHQIHAQVSGCTDPLANNYNSSATSNDGSCTYASTNATATVLFNPPAALAEISGMIFWNDAIWAQRDSYNGGPFADPPFYAMDTAGNITRTITLTGATNVDWEDMAQDNDYIYIGDFGNNTNGNRTDLKIYKIAKSDLTSTSGDVSVTASVINFSYSDQTDFTATGANNTNFDCEAMIVMNNKIYLFTKQWVSEQTSVYELPVTAGTHVANKISTFNVQGLITGADNAGTKSIVLSAYKGTERFLYLLYDFLTADPLSGNKRKLNIAVTKQTEAVAFRNEEYIYISNEQLVIPPFINISQSVESVNLTTFIHSFYLLPIESIGLYLRPADQFIRINWEIQPATDFHSGEIQKRKPSDAKYQQVLSISQAKGYAEDKQQDGYTGSMLYRVMARDKDGRISYSKDVKAIIGNKQFLEYRGQQLYAQGDNAILELYNGNGSLIQRINVNGKGIADLGKFPAGRYIAVLKREGIVVHSIQVMR